MRVANKKYREFVERKEAFNGSNLRGYLVGRDRCLYVVQSYGWYPLLVYDFEKAVWYRNSERYSVSTSKQMSQSCPLCDCVMITHEQMKDMITSVELYGWKEVVA